MDFNGNEALAIPASARQKFRDTLSAFGATPAPAVTLFMTCF
jgi:hypothetical protein